MDATQYPVGSVPELALRQIFARSNVPEPVRLAITKRGLLDVDALGALGDTMAAAKQTAEALLGTQLGRKKPASPISPSSPPRGRRPQRFRRSGTHAAHGSWRTPHASQIWPYRS